MYLLYKAYMNKRARSSNCAAVGQVKIYLLPCYYFILLFQNLG